MHGVTELDKKWIEDIMKIIDDRITTEEERVPSYRGTGKNHVGLDYYGTIHLFLIHTSTYLHLKIVAGFYQQMELMLLIGKIQMWQLKYIHSLTKGCKCKSGCTSNQCSCRKQLSYCGPGCECHNCQNLPVKSQVEAEDSSTNESEDSDIDDTEVITEAIKGYKTLPNLIQGFS